MLVTELPRLLQSDYSRANYLRKEITLALNTARLYSTATRKLVLINFLSGVLQFAIDELDVAPTNPASPNLVPDMVP